MIPTPGMTGSYIDTKCSVHIGLIECEDLGNDYNFHLEVLKSLNTEDGCVYKKGERFWFRQPKNADISQLEKYVVWDSI